MKGEEVYERNEMGIYRRKRKWNWTSEMEWWWERWLGVWGGDEFLAYVQFFQLVPIIHTVQIILIITYFSFLFFIYFIHYLDPQPFLFFFHFIFIAPRFYWTFIISRHSISSSKLQILNLNLTQRCRKWSNSIIVR